MNYSGNTKQDEISSNREARFYKSSVTSNTMFPLQEDNADADVPTVWDDVALKGQGNQDVHDGIALEVDPLKTLQAMLICSNQNHTDISTSIPPQISIGSKSIPPPSDGAVGSKHIPPPPPLMAAPVRDAVREGDQTFPCRPPPLYRPCQRSINFLRNHIPNKQQQQQQQRHNLISHPDQIHITPPNTNEHIEGFKENSGGAEIQETLQSTKDKRPPPPPYPYWNRQEFGFVPSSEDCQENTGNYVPAPLDEGTKDKFQEVIEEVIAHNERIDLVRIASDQGDNGLSGESHSEVKESNNVCSRKKWKFHESFHSKKKNRVPKDKGVIPCKFCNRKFKRKQDVLRHMRYARDSGTRDHQCTEAEITQFLQNIHVYEKEPVLFQFSNQQSDQTTLFYDNYTSLPQGGFPGTTNNQNHQTWGTTDTSAAKMISYSMTPIIIQNLQNGGLPVGLESGAFTFGHNPVFHQPEETASVPNVRENHTASEEKLQVTLQGNQENNMESQDAYDLNNDNKNLGTGINMEEDARDLLYFNSSSPASTIPAVDDDRCLSPIENIMKSMKWNKEENNLEIVSVCQEVDLMETEGRNKHHLPEEEVGFKMSEDKVNQKEAHINDCDLEKNKKSYDESVGCKAVSHDKIILTKDINSNCLLSDKDLDSVTSSTPHLDKDVNQLDTENISKQDENDPKIVPVATATCIKPGEGQEYGEIVDNSSDQIREDSDKPESKNQQLNKDCLEMKKVKPMKLKNMNIILKDILKNNTQKPPTSMDNGDYNTSVDSVGGVLMVDAQTHNKDNVTLEDGAEEIKEGDKKQDEEDKLDKEYQEPEKGDENANERHFLAMFSNNLLQKLFSK